jgi:adenylosuccinate synthase
VETLCKRAAHGSHIGFDGARRHDVDGNVSRCQVSCRALGVTYDGGLGRGFKESERELRQSISSTGSGTGAATAAKIMRHPETSLIKDVLHENSWLRPYVRDVRNELYDLLDRGYRVILEGTQGFGLSLHHSRMFPKTTSKDTTAAQFVMEAGLSPLLVDQIFLVIRTFPIRVAGTESGPMKNEIPGNSYKRNPATLTRSGN